MRIFSLSELSFPIELLPFLHWLKLGRAMQCSCRSLIPELMSVEETVAVHPDFGQLSEIHMWLSREPWSGCVTLSSCNYHPSCGH